MKNYLLLTALLATGLFATAQNTAKDVFTKDEIVWYGLDFSKAKMVGEFDQGAGAAPATGNDIKTKYVPAWNSVVLDEEKKYDLQKAFHKTSVYKDLSVVEKSNSKINADKIMTFNDYKFDSPDATVDEIVKSYGNGEKKEGIGVVFIVESFNKARQEGSMYVTFFDIATKKVLFTEKMYGKAGGFGLRNYWIKTVYNVLREIEGSEYKAWEKKYGK